MKIHLTKVAEELIIIVIVIAIIIAIIAYFAIYSATAYFRRCRHVRGGNLDMKKRLLNLFASFCMAMVLLLGAGFASDEAAAAISDNDVILPVGISQSNISLAKAYNQIPFLIAEGTYTENIVKITNLASGASGFSSTVGVDITNAATYTANGLASGQTDTTAVWQVRESGDNGNLFNTAVLSTTSFTAEELSRSSFYFYKQQSGSETYRICLKDHAGKEYYLKASMSSADSCKLELTETSTDASVWTIFNYSTDGQCACHTKVTYNNTEYKFCLSAASGGLCLVEYDRMVTYIKLYGNLSSITGNASYSGYDAFRLVCGENNVKNVTVARKNTSSTNSVSLPGLSDGNYIYWSDNKSVDRYDREFSDYTDASKYIGLYIIDYDKDTNRYAGGSNINRSEYAGKTLYPVRGYTLNYSATNLARGSSLDVRTGSISDSVCWAAVKNVATGTAVAEGNWVSIAVPTKEKTGYIYTLESVSITDASGNAVDTSGLANYEIKTLSSGAKCVFFKMPDYAINVSLNLKCEPAPVPDSKSVVGKFITVNEYESPLAYVNTITAKDGTPFKLVISTKEMYEDGEPWTTISSNNDDLNEYYVDNEDSFTYKIESCKWYVKIGDGQYEAIDDDQIVYNSMNNDEHRAVLLNCENLPSVSGNTKVYYKCEYTLKRDADGEAAVISDKKEIVLTADVLADNPVGLIDYNADETAHLKTDHIYVDGDNITKWEYKKADDTEWTNIPLDTVVTSYQYDKYNYITSPFEFHIALAKVNTNVYMFTVTTPDIYTFRMTNAVGSVNEVTCDFSKLHEHVWSEKTYYSNKGHVQRCTVAGCGVYKDDGESHELDDYGHCTICQAGAPGITTTELAGGTVGIEYTQNLAAVGNDTITWSIEDGSTLPAGLTLDSSTGVISGTPAADGNFSFTVKATNSVSSHTKTLSINIVKKVPEITAPVAAVDLVYNGTEQMLISAGMATGGTLKYKLREGEYSETLPVATDAGTYTVYYKVFGNTEYQDSEEASVTVTVSKKTVLVKVKDQSITAGSRMPESYDLEYSGFVEGQSAEDAVDNYQDTKGTVDVSVDGKTVGDFDITAPTVTLKDAYAGNYTLTYENGKLTVKPVRYYNKDAGDNVTNKTGDKDAGQVASTDVTIKNTETKEADGTKTVIATVDQKTADQIIEKAVENKSAEIVIDAVTESSEGAAEEAAAEVTIPADTVTQLSEKTNADVVIKTGNAEITLNKETIAAISEQIKEKEKTGDANSTVKLTVTAVSQDKSGLRLEVKIETAGGEIKNCKSGKVTMKIRLNSELASKNLACVYIDDKGIYHKVKNANQSGEYFTFTTQL